MKSLRLLAKVEKDLARIKAKPLPCGRGFQEQYHREKAALIAKRAELKISVLHDFMADLEEYSQESRLSNALGSRREQSAANRCLKLHEQLINAFRDVLLRD